MSEIQCRAENDGEILHVHLVVFFLKTNQINEYSRLEQ